MQADLLTRAVRLATETTDPAGDARAIRRALKASAVGHVARLFPNVPDPAAWVSSAAKRSGPNDGFMGLKWVECALRWAEHKGASSPTYVAVTMENWHRNGFPGEPPLPIPVAAPVYGRVKTPDECDDAGPLTPAGEIALLEAMAARPGERDPFRRYAQRRLDALTARGALSR